MFTRSCVLSRDITCVHRRVTSGLLVLPEHESYFIEYHCTINLFYFAGFLIDFISGPVSVGFTSAAAIIIATTQIKDVLGLSFPGSKFLDVWEQLFEHISETRLWDTLLGFICMAVLLLLRVTAQFYLMKRKKHHDRLTWKSHHEVNLNQHCK